MPTFDPTKPAANSLISSAELRDQLNALNDSLGSLSTTVDLNNVNTWNQFDQLNNSIGTVQALPDAFTDPVSAADLEVLRAKINELISAIQAGAAI